LHILIQGSRRYGSTIKSDGGANNGKLAQTVSSTSSWQH